MAKKKKVRRSQKFTLPLAVVGGVAGGMKDPVKYLMQGDVDGFLWDVGRVYTGYDNRDRAWNFGNLKRGIVPLLIGVIVHKGANKFGLNRAISRSGIPVLRI